MKKIIVNQDACIGCGACIALDSEHFAFNEDGLSHAISEENLESAELANAISSCPTCAISLEDGECTCEDCHCTQTDNCGCHCFEDNEA